MLAGGASGTLPQMDGEGEVPEDLNVSLSWPGDDEADTQRALRRKSAAEERAAELPEPAPVAAAPEPPPPIDGPSEISWATNLRRRRSPSATDRPGATSPLTRASSSEQASAAGGAQMSLAGRIDGLATALASTTARIDTLTDAMVTLRGLVNERMGDVGDVVTRSQTRLSHELEQAFDRVQAQTTTQLDEALRQARSEMTKNLEDAAATAGGDGARHIDKVATAISSELANVAQRLSDQVGGTSERVGADVSALSDSVADALTQVADRLEHVALSNHAQQDIVESVAQALDDVAVRFDDLDSSSRSRHERMIAAIEDLRLKRVQSPPVNLGPVTTGLERVETLLEALVESGDGTADRVTAAAAAVERLEGMEATIGDQFNEAVTGAVRDLTETADRATDEIKSAIPPVTERSTLVAMARIEDRMAEMTRQRDEQDQATQEALDIVEETLSRLASAQAEDLERILDTVENVPPPPAPPRPVPLTLAAADAQRLTRIEDELRKVNRQPKSAIMASDVDSTALEQMAALGNQIEALRRRMAIRGRSETPGLDASTLEAIADAVVARLSPTALGPARAVPANRATKKAPVAKRTAKQTSSPAPKRSGSRVPKT